MDGTHLRRTAAVLVAGLLVAACSSAATSPMTASPLATTTDSTGAATLQSSVSQASATTKPAATPSIPSATVPAMPVPAVEATAEPTPTPFVPGLEADGPWLPAGSLPADWSSSLAVVVPLRDGGALALGVDATDALRWDRGTTTWHPAAGLNASRSDFAAVPLRDGRVLVAGGIDKRDGNHWRSYSSAYVYDPTKPAGTWTKVGLMGTARTAPAAAVLPDGRVLVAGGSYKDGPPYEGLGDRRSGVVLAKATPNRIGPVPSQRTLYDVNPPSIGAALATAEIFDPTTGRWSPTAPMRFARVGAVAATLSDGRVLIVGPSSAHEGAYEIDERALGTAEVYDPATGRFAQVGSLPPIDTAAIATAGVDVPEGHGGTTVEGSLVPLADGGAMLVGMEDYWKHSGAVTRSFRFDGDTGAWHQVGPAHAWFYVASRGYAIDRTPGPDLGGAAVAPLLDGRVLVAGGGVSGEWMGDDATRVARLFGPTSGTWVRLPPMPVGRCDDIATTLADGSILLVGGVTEPGRTAPPIRFVPTP